ncbi:PREDICTED: pleckstrin-like [Amphimedon queenslandica]|nr:PREDICTED: pleckstrin-like [Amphimedon queenslandica]XP_019851286.1 PREDICTED: pleckstrin-like [Amphimedon queenslandica]|eukprot:XP_011403542.1 PREDICTED: pleckstrin-like [Amphimedon queenslandica]
MAARTKSLSKDLVTEQRGEVQKVGFLRKKGHVRRNWLDRWFVLTTEGLYYYKNRSDAKPVGVVPLFSASVNEDTLQRHQNVLTVCTVEGKDYHIQASTRDEMLMWIQYIDNIIKDRSKQPPNYQAGVTQNPAAASKSARTPSSSSKPSSEPIPSHGSRGGTKRNSDSEESEED